MSGHASSCLDQDSIQKGRIGSKQDDNQEAVLTRAYSGSAQSSPDFSPKISEAFEVLKLEIQLFTLLPSASDSRSLQ